ncbi:MAG TPA: hypothetical protein PLI96_11300 [Halothiobacillus sp.]|nr:hypothetical protein [Halothiobacillus sp.]
MTTFEFDGRIYEVINYKTPRNVAEHLKSNGWDGFVYIAKSYPIGRQRKVFTGMFYI